jgi:hypothetical protein
MDQAVMTFASSAARGSAIGTATEGMVTWLNDQNALQVYDGTAWNGLAASGGNAIINGAFEINQRNFTSSTSSGYGFDRWDMQLSGATGTYSAQTFTLGAAPVAGYESRNFARLAVTTGNDQCRLLTKIESVRSFAGQTVTLSFWAKGTNPTTAGNLKAQFLQYFGTGGGASGEVTVTAQTFVLTANWTRYALTFAMPSISGKTIGTSGNDSVEIHFGQASDTSTDAWTLDIWGVQLEAGPTANAFRRNANSLQGELAACQRYYVRYSDINGVIGGGFSFNSTTGYIIVQPPVAMRAVPTSLEFTALVLSNGTTYTSGVTALTLSSSGRLATRVTATTAAVQTTNQPTHLFVDTSGFLGINAEL